MYLFINHWLGFLPTHNLTIHLSKKIEVSSQVSHLPIKVSGNRSIYEKVYYRFIHDLSKRVHSRRHWKTHKQMLRNYGAFQVGPERSPHFHIAIEKPDHIDDWEFDRAVHRVCERTRWIRSDIQHSSPSKKSVRRWTPHGGIALNNHSDINLIQGGEWVTTFNPHQTPRKIWDAVKIDRVKEDISIEDKMGLIGRMKPDLFYLIDNDFLTIDDAYHEVRTMGLNKYNHRTDQSVMNTKQKTKFEDASVQDVSGILVAR